MSELLFQLQWMELTEGKFEGENLGADESECERLFFLVFALMLTECQLAMGLYCFGV